MKFDIDLKVEHGKAVHFVDSLIIKTNYDYFKSMRLTEEVIRRKLNRTPDYAVTILDGYQIQEPTPAARGVYLISERISARRALASDNPVEAQLIEGFRRQLTGRDPAKLQAILGWLPDVLLHK